MLSFSIVFAGVWICCGTYALAQSVSEADLIGTWRVEPSTYVVEPNMGNSSGTGRILKNDGTELIFGDDASMLATLPESMPTNFSAFELILKESGSFLATNVPSDFFFDCPTTEAGGTWALRAEMELTLFGNETPGLRSAYDEVGGIVYFGRMLDKIRLKARGALPADYNTGTKEWCDFDSRCARFLKVKYGALKERTLRGGSDLQILRWCFRNGRKLSKEEIEIWNTFMKKRGWRDGSSEVLAADKRAAGLAARSDIVTWFDLFDADEQRPNA